MNQESTLSSMKMMLIATQDIQIAWEKLKTQDLATQLNLSSTCVPKIGNHWCTSYQYRRVSVSHYRHHPHRVEIVQNG